MIFYIGGSSSTQRYSCQLISSKGVFLADNSVFSRCFWRKMRIRESKMLRLCKVKVNSRNRCWVRWCAWTEYMKCNARLINNVIERAPYRGDVAKSMLRPSFSRNDKPTGWFKAVQVWEKTLFSETVTGMAWYGIGMYKKFVSRSDSATASLASVPIIVRSLPNINPRRLSSGVELERCT